MRVYADTFHPYTAHWVRLPSIKVLEVSHFEYVTGRTMYVQHGEKLLTSSCSLCILMRMAFYGFQLCSTKFGCTVEACVAMGPTLEVHE